MQSCAIFREQSLVGGDHRRSRGHRGQDQGAGRLDSPEQFDDDIRAGRCKGLKIARDQRRVDAFAPSGRVADTHPDEPQGRARASSEVIGRLREQTGDLATHISTAQESDGQLTGQLIRRSHRIPFQGVVRKP
ncbi:unannotated protein [freshwater metagenome]|uniref:Unannotated protein n=1 Tax=freshwater metagenome TaxID=449393 RepID=A0A6J7BZW2_9ZZZZ